MNSQKNEEIYIIFALGSDFFFQSHVYVKNKNILYYISESES